MLTLHIMYMHTNMHAVCANILTNLNENDLDMNVKIHKRYNSARI